MGALPSNDEPLEAQLSYSPDERGPSAAADSTPSPDDHSEALHLLFQMHSSPCEEGHATPMLLVYEPEEDASHMLTADWLDTNWLPEDKPLAPQAPPDTSTTPKKRPYDAANDAELMSKEELDAELMSKEELDAEPMPLATSKEEEDGVRMPPPPTPKQAVEGLTHHLALWPIWSDEDSEPCPAAQVEDLPDPEHSDMLNPLTMKWRILGERPKHRKQPALRASLQQQLSQQGVPSAHDVSVSFLQNTGKGSYMLLGFDTDEQYQAAKDATLTLEATRCRLVAGCPAWAAEYTILKTSDHCPRMKQEDLLNLLYSAVQHAVRPAHILLQTTQACLTDADGVTTTGKQRFSGTAWILGTLQPGKTTRDLPAFLLTPGTSAAPLFFQGRGNPCASCPTARPPHQSNACPKRTCHVCKKRGHSADQCQQAKRPRLVGNYMP